MQDTQQLEMQMRTLHDMAKTGQYDAAALQSLIEAHADQHLAHALAMSVTAVAGDAHGILREIVMMLVTNPEDPHGYLRLAQVLAGEGYPECARVALGAGWSHYAALGVTLQWSPADIERLRSEYYSQCPGMG